MSPKNMTRYWSNSLTGAGNYHRLLAYYLQQHGFDLKLISSAGASRIREAMYNSWDKNDPKDAQVILHMPQTGLTQTLRDLSGGEDRPQGPGGSEETGTHRGVNRRSCLREHGPH